MDHHTKEHLHETPWVVTGPLIALAIPSVIIGWLTIGPVLFGDYFEGAIFNLEGQNPLEIVGEEFHGPAAFVQHGFLGPAVYLALAGAIVAWFLYLKRPDIPARLLTQFGASAPAAHEQVLLRLVQRERAGARHARASASGSGRSATRR